MDLTELDNWMKAYVRAWNSNDPGDIGQLFAPDGKYYTAPHRKPWVGRDEIVSGWLGRKDEPGEFEFRYEALGVAGPLGFVRGWTAYRDPPIEYSNLWVVRLNATGECEEFIEWWMTVSDPEVNG